MSNRIQFNKINTAQHHAVGTVWQFRGCAVEMHVDGFSCTCRKTHKEKCNHMKSVEFGLLGVGMLQWKLPTREVYND
jgi:hypothetical protein